MSNIELVRPLTAKQSRFINEYLIDMCGAAAAVRCGYSKKTSRAIACELLTKPDIQAVLQARQAAMAKELQITRQGVISGLLDAVEMGRHQQNPAAMVGALREVAKMLGFYEPEVKKIEVLTIDQSSRQANFAAMNDAQLLALIAQGEEAAQTSA